MSAWFMFGTSVTEERLDAAKIKHQAEQTRLQSSALLIPGRRRFFARCQASDDVSGPVSGQDLREIGLVAAFHLLGLLGAALFRVQRHLPDPAHRNRQAIGFELELIFFSVLVRRGAGDTGNLSRREVAKLPAYSGR